MMIRFDLMEFYKHRFYKHMDLYFVLFLYYHYKLVFISGTKLTF